jgi:hypothetical protein
MRVDEISIAAGLDKREELIVQLLIGHGFEEESGV